MLLKNKIKKILIDNKLSLNDFYKKTGLSRTFYYSIRDGKTTSLLSTTAVKITEAFPEVDYEWLMNDQVEDETVLNISKLSIEDIIAEKVYNKTQKDILEMKESIRIILELTKDTAKNVDIAALNFDAFTDKCEDYLDKIEKKINQL